MKKDPIASNRTPPPESHAALTHDLLSEINKLPVIDAHEHLWTETERLGFEVDVFSLLAPYVHEDLVNAGASPDLRALWSLEPSHGHPRRPGQAPDKIWEDMAPYWNSVRQTSHTQSFLNTLKIIFDVEDLQAGNYREISTRIAGHSKPGLYQKVLEDICGIRYYIGVKAINYSGIIPPEGIGRWIMHMWPFACWSSRADVVQLEKDTGGTIRSLTDADGLLFATIEKAKRAGYVGIKICRNAEYPIGRVDKAVASEIFDRVLRSSPGNTLPQQELQPLWDYCLYQLFEAARLNDMTVAVHTTGFPSSCLCTLLVDAVKSFPDVRFDLFHGSFPLTREIGLLAKAFPNVYLNMCFMPAVSRAMTITALNEWLDLVPQSKIIGFGGDCHYVENVAGALAMTRQVIAETLATRVHSGWMTEGEAVETARQLLFANPAEIYRLAIS